MPTIEEIRQMYPDTAGKSDREILQRISQLTGMDPNDTAQYLGYRDTSNWMTDTAVSVTKGAVGLGQAVVGLGNLATDGRVGRGIRRTFGGDLDDVQQGLGRLYSDEQQEANEAVAAADGAVDTAKAYFNNPSVIAHQGIEALVPAAGVMGIASKAAKGAAASARAMGPVQNEVLREVSKRASNNTQIAGWGTVTGGQSAERIEREAPGDSQAMYTGAALSGATGAVLTAGASILPGGLMAKEVQGGFLKRTGANLANQASMESAQEVAQVGSENYALNRPITEGMGKAAVGGFVSGGALGALGAHRANTQFRDPPPRPVEAEGSQAAFTTEDLIARAVHPAQPLTPQQIIEQSLGMNRAPMNDQASMEEALNEPTALYGQDPSTGFEHNINMGQLTQANLDPGAVAMAQAQQQGKAQKDPPPTQQELDAINQKFIGVQQLHARDAAGKLRMREDGEPLMLTFFDGSDKPKKEGAMPRSYSPSEAKAALEKLAIEERKKPQWQRVAEQKYSDAVFEVLGERPTSSQVKRIATMLKLDESESTAEVLYRVETELNKLESSKKPDMFVKDTLTAYKKILDKEVEGTKKAEKPAPAPAPTPAAEPVAATPEAEMLAPAPAEPVDVMSLLQKAADAAAEGDVVTLRDGKKERKLTKQQYIAFLAGLKGPNLRRMQMLLGLDNENRPSGEPMTHAQIAEKEGVSASAITKWADRMGLKEAAVSKAVYQHIEPVGETQDERDAQTTTLLSEKEGEASGFTIRNPGELAAGGFHGDEYTAADQRADAEANQVLKGAEVPVKDKPHQAPAKTRQDKAAEDLKAREKAAEELTRMNREKAAAANRAAMTERAATSEYAESAARMWSAMRERGIVPYDQLAAAARVRWVTMIDEHMRNIKDGGEGVPEADLLLLMRTYGNDTTTSAGVSSDASGRSGDAENVRPAGGEGSTDAAGEPRSAPVVTTKKRRVPVKPDAQQSGGSGQGRYTTESLKAEILDFMGVDKLPAKMRIVNAKDISKKEAKWIGMHAKTQAWVDKYGNVVMLADRIEADARAVFLHEVGSHLGFDQVFDAQERKQIVDQIRRMRREEVGLARDVAQAAFERMERYDGKSGDAIRDSETIAYFIEEAVTRMHEQGRDIRIRSQRRGLLEQLVGKIYDAIRRAYQSFMGTTPKNLTLDDIVDLAYGMAKLNLDEDHAIPFKGLVFAQQSAVDDNIKRLPKDLQAPVRGITAALRDTTGGGLRRLAFMPDLADWAEKHGIKSAQRIADFAARKGAYRHELDQEVGKVIKMLQDLPADEKATAQKFMLDSTMEQKWGYTPDWRKNVKVDQMLASRWRAMSVDARNAIDAVFKHNERLWQEKHDAIQKMSVALRQEMIADAEANGKSQADIDALWADMYSLTEKVPAKLDGPYTPLRRFGKLVITSKSNEYMDAVAQKDKEKIKKLETDPKHFFVEHVDSSYRAQLRVDELKAQNPDNQVEYSAKEDYGKMGAGFEVLERLAGVVRDKAADEDAKYASAVYAALQEAIIQSMGEYNSRTSILHRRNISGVNPDQIGRAFATQAYADNRFISSVMFNKEINDAMRDMRQEVRQGGDRAVKQDFFNVMQEHRQLDLQPQMPWVGHAMKFTTLWRLVTSPAYYIQYIAQPITMFLPVVQGKHGYKNAMRAMTDAMKEVLAANEKGNRLNVNIDRLGNDKERAMLNELKKTGTIQIGHDQSFGHIEQTPDDGFKRVWAKVTTKAGELPLALEAHNRVASALAAYRLERQKGSSHEAAVEYTRKIINNTYGDYTSASAPAWMKGSPIKKLALQYKQFQLIHLALLARLMHNAFGEENAETKRIARLQLGFMAGHYGVLAGAMGLPLAHLLATVVRGVFGDEEDEDNETFIKRHVDSELVQDMILGGLPRVMGVDISSRVGIGDLHDPSRYTEWSRMFDGKKEFAEEFVSLAGPFVGLIPQLAEGISSVYNGDYYVGLGKLLPKGAADAVKAMQLADEGVRSKSGQTLIPEDEVSTWAVIAKAAGLNHTSISDPQHDAAMVSRIQQKFKNEVNDLKSDYVKAIKDGEDVEEIIDAWQELMERQKKAGIKPTPLSHLYRAPATMSKRDAMVIDGVPYREGTKGLVENVIGDEEEEEEEE